MKVFERNDSYRVSEQNQPDRIIPKDPANNDYHWIQQWIVGGGRVEIEPGQTNFEAPDWTSFRLAMMFGSGYNRIAQAVYSVMPLVQQRLEMAMSFDQPHIPTIQMLWSEWITLCPPTIAEVEQFQQFAQSFSIPFTFADNGSIEIFYS